MNRFLGLTILLLATAVNGQVFQFAVPARDVQSNDITAYLWVSPDADRLRGVLVGGRTLMEQEFTGDARIRAACVAEKLAIVYFSPPLDATFSYFENDSGRLLQKALDDLAAESGYGELSVAPLFPFGHSVSSIFASRVVCWARERCFGALAFKGGLNTPTNDPKASLIGVPILVIKGQFEEFGPGPSGNLRDFENRETSWQGMRAGILKRRETDERHFISFLVEPGASHFAWAAPDGEMANYTARFIRKAAKSRIPDWPADAKSPVQCREVLPGSGALTGTNLSAVVPYPDYDKFLGDKRRAFWHPDVEMAGASFAFHAGQFTKQPQFVTFADPKSGQPVYVGHDLRLRLNPHWIEADTFQVAGAFLDHAPDKYPKAEPPVGHAAGPIRFRAFAGTVHQVGTNTFRVAPNGRQKIGAEILAFHDGDTAYRHAEQQARVNVPEKLTRGKPQTITFTEIPPVRGKSSVELSAASDSKLPVRFAVVSGPAVVENGVLKLREVPRRAKRPLKITVLAYQFGSAVEPFVQSAEPVQRTIFIEP